MAAIPSVILVFSGKRKSGKDFITDTLQQRLGKAKCSVLRLSAPLKGQYAIEHGLDYARLLDSSDYKERYRADMILWGETRRRADPGFFARVIATGPGSEMPVWLISDARRKTDVNHFRETYTGSTLVMTVRVIASDETRRERGWVFAKGVDDAESECGLDSGVDFDITIRNDSECKLEVDEAIGKLVHLINDINKTSS